MKATYVTHSGSDLMVVNAARVSFAKESEWVYPEEAERLGYSVHPKLKEGDQKLIKYLASHKHFSPFNHCFITLHVKAPIFVARQLQKHEYMPWNEVSRRYVDDEPEFYAPEVWRGRSADKKQGSEGVSVWNHGQGTGYREEEYEVMESVLSLYNSMIEVGVAPEQARMVLPQSTYTEWYWSGTLKAWAKMYNLRTKPDAQWETQQIALQCGEIIAPLFPHAWAALKESDL